MTPSTAITVSGSLPSDLDLSLARFLEPYVGESLTDAATTRVRQAIRAGQPPHYTEDWAAFNFLYFSANFLKAYLVARSVAHHIGQRAVRLLDLGCGGGSATAAFVLGLMECGNRLAKVVALDSSRAQLDTFRAVTAPWISSLDQDLGVEVNEGDIRQFAESDARHFDIVLLSYSMGELDEESRNALRKALLARHSEHGSLTVIVESEPSCRGVSVEVLDKQRFTIPFDAVQFSCPALKGLNLSTPPKFCESTRSEVFERYAQCWKEHDVPQLEHLFTEDCEYEINGDRVLTGLDSIRAYWLHNAERQRNIEVSYTTLMSTDERLVVDWRASFDRIDTRDKRILSGLMLVELSSGRIARLREYYSQRRTPDVLT